MDNITDEIQRRLEETQRALRGLMLAPDVHNIDTLIAQDQVATALGKRKLSADAQTNLRVLVFTEAIADSAAAELAALKPEARLAALQKMAESWQAALGRQIVLPDDYARFAERPEWLAKHLKNGMEGLRYQAQQGGADPDHLIGKVLDHDKGYPRAVNFISEYEAPAAASPATVLGAFLNGFSNTDVFTGKPSQESYADQVRRGYAAASVDVQNGLWAKLFGKLCMDLDQTKFDADLFPAWITALEADVLAALDGIFTAEQVRAVLRDADRLKAICAAAGMA